MSLGLDSKLPRSHRTIFSDYQSQRMEEFYKYNPYPSLNDKYELAYLLNLDRAIVQVWFNNRRAKDKRSGIPIVKKKKHEDRYIPKGCADMPNYRGEVFVTPNQYPVRFFNDQFIPEQAYYTFPNNGYENYEFVRGHLPPREEVMIQNDILHNFGDRMYTIQTIPRQVSVQQPTAMPTIRSVNPPNNEIHQSRETLPHLQMTSRNIHNSDHEKSDNLDPEMTSPRQENHESAEVGSSQELNLQRNSTSNSLEENPSHPKVVSQSDRIGEIPNDEKVRMMAYRKHIISKLSVAIGSQSSDGKRNTIILRVVEDTSNESEAEYERDVGGEDDELDAELEADIEAELGDELEAELEAEYNEDELDALFG